MDNISKPISKAVADERERCARFLENVASERGSSLSDLKDSERVEERVIEALLQAAHRVRDGEGPADVPGRARARRIQHIGAAVFGILSSLLMLSGLEWGKLGNHLPVAAGDASLCAWTMEYVFRSILGNPAHFLHAGIFYPNLWTLFFSDHLMGVQPLYSAIRLFTSNVILAYNLILITSTVLCFLSMYVYLNPKFESFLARILGSCIFAFASSRLAQFGHMQLVVLFYMPVAILALEKSIEADSRFWHWLFVILASLQFLAGYYLGYPFLVYAFLHGTVLCWSSVPRLPHFRRFSIDLLATGMTVSLFSWPYVIVQKWYDHRGDLGEIINGSASAKSYLSASIHNRTWGNLLAGFQSSHMPWEKWLFLGVTVYGLFLCSLYMFADKRRYRTARTTGWLGGAIMLFVLSLGPVLVIDGKPTGFRLPYLVLYYLVPGFSSLTVPSRIGLLLVFPVACLSAFAVANIVSSLRRRRLSTLAGLLAGVLIAAFLFESRESFAQIPFPSTLTIPKAYTWLNTHQIEGGVLDWPVGEQGFTTHEYMLFQLVSQKPTVHGHSGYYPESYKEILRRFEEPSYDDLRYLKALGISTIVCHRRGELEAHHQRVDRLEHDGYLRAIYSDPDTTIYDNTVPRQTSSELRVISLQPEYADTVIGREFGALLKVEPNDGVWLNPTGHDGVSGRAIYRSSDGRPLVLKDAWLRSQKVVRGEIEESLKLVPLAAIDGDIAFPVRPLNLKDSLEGPPGAGLGVRWEFDRTLRLGSLEFSVKPAQQFRKEYEKRPPNGNIRVRASHNDQDVAGMLDRNLGTRWTSKENMTAGMYLEFECVRNTSLTSCAFGSAEITSITRPRSESAQNSQTGHFKMSRFGSGLSDNRVSLWRTGWTSRWSTRRAE